MVKQEDNAASADRLDRDARHRKISILDDLIDSRELFGSAREIIIGHGEDRYRLRVTSQNKLILTK